MPHGSHTVQVRGLSLVYEGAPLAMEPKLAYIQRKEAERKSRPGAAPTAAAAAAAAPAAGRKRRAEGEPEGGQRGGDGGAAAAAAAAAGGEEGGEAAEVEVGEYEPGCVLAFDFGEAEFAEVRGGVVWGMDVWDVVPCLAGWVAGLAGGRVLDAAGGGQCW